MPPSVRTRGRKRKRPLMDGDQTDEDGDTPRGLAFHVTRDALEMLQETLKTLTSMLENTCSRPADSLRTFQLEAMSIHTEIMGLHLDLSSANGKDATIERQAHSFQRRAFKLHQSIAKLQPQMAKHKEAATKIKLKPSTRRQTRNSDAAPEPLEMPAVVTQTPTKEKRPVETSDLATQTIEADLLLRKMPGQSCAQTKVGKIPRFFLGTLSNHRYEEFTTEEITKALELGSQLADFMNSDSLFRNDYSNFFGGLVGGLWNQITKRQDWDAMGEDALKKKWFGHSKELAYAHYTIEVLEVWRAQRDTAESPNATTKPNYWALEKTDKQIAYAVRWMRYLKVAEPVATLASCMIIESTRRG